jgi:hypothetical protein
MSIGPLLPIIDAAYHARQVDGNARSVSAAQIAGPTGEKNVTDDSGADGRRPWERPTPQEETPPADPHAPAGGVEPVSGSHLDITA